MSSELGHPRGRLGASFIKWDKVPTSEGCHTEADEGLGLLQLPSLVQNRTRDLGFNSCLPARLGLGQSRECGRRQHLGQCVQHESARWAKSLSRAGNRTVQCWPDPRAIAF